MPIVHRQVRIVRRILLYEAHHLKPLGTPQIGPDIESNIIVVCPNYHVLLDYGSIEINQKSFKSIKYNINNEMIYYHSKYIFKINNN